MKMMKMPNYSIEEINQNKIMDKIFKIACVIVMVGGVLFFGAWNYYKGYDAGLLSENSNYEKSVEYEKQVHNQAYQEGLNDRQISLLKEKADCDKQGGEFGIQMNVKGLVVIGDRVTTEGEVSYNLTCISPAKEIFNIKLK